ncbi:MAG: bifunctional diaminohydroxyphosphoribosylaminopyrimidine deaminase/5-amino-6-(5-phosphoribosylamino)uracil reductase RibD [Cyclobacteriaceae bacterium]
MDSADINFMKRALELAELGRGYVSPNPMVGCVIVYENKIIGEGYHKRFGEAHAEVHALASVENQALIHESTAYVTLEPCAHHGRTPPCADLLVERGIKRVVIASSDPFVKVNGKGIQKLMDANIRVEMDVLRDEGDELNSRFMTFHEKNRPFVILKWAQTSDGFIARENFDSKWISNEKSRQLVHKWRSEEDAILVGTNTAIHDNPSLTVREWEGRNPTRILLDSNLEVDQDTNLFNREASTLIFNTSLEKEEGLNKWVKIEDITAKSILRKLHEQNIQSIIVEGGTQTLNSFIEEDCWDEARIFTASEKFGSGISAPKIEGKLIGEETFSGDILKTYRNKWQKT